MSIPTNKEVMTNRTSFLCGNRNNPRVFSNERHLFDFKVKSHETGNSLVNPLFRTGSPFTITYSTHISTSIQFK